MLGSRVGGISLCRALLSSALGLGLGAHDPTTGLLILLDQDYMCMHTHTSRETEVLGKRGCIRHTETETLVRWVVYGTPVNRWWLQRPDGTVSSWCRGLMLALLTH